MKEQIKEMIKELKQDIGVLSIQEREISNQISKLYVIKTQLENILKNEE